MHTSEGLQSGIPPEAREALARLVLPDATVVVPKESRISLKDRPYADLLHEQPDLGVAITTTMDWLARTGREVPLFHITSRAVRLPDGSEQSTGYLESMRQHGLRARDTNVAALVERGETTHIADPEYFAEHPYKFLRAMADSLGHYLHHGSRTNKQTLGEQRDTGKGLPTMVVIDASEVPLIPGTDYDDHFMLGEVVPPSRIMGVIDLTDRKPINPEDVAAIASQFLETTEQYAATTVS